MVCQTRFTPILALLIGILGAGGAFDPASAQTAAAGRQRPPPQLSPTLPSEGADPFLQLTTYSLWPDRLGARQVNPTLSVFIPQPGKHSGAAVIVAPGGGYISLAANLEGRQVADWLASRGITAFVLRYRYGENSRLPIPIEDGERAVRFVRANAASLGVDPDRIGLMGFSAGGHLAAMTTSGSDAGVATSDDPVERASSRPDFLVLAYPWLEATRVLDDGTSSYCGFASYAGWDCGPQDFASISPFPTIAGKAPPTFIYHTTDDETVPVSGSVRLYTLLHEAGVDVEMHLFATGRHGSGLGGSDPALSIWPNLLAEWLRARGYFAREPSSGDQP